MYIFDGFQSEADAVLFATTAALHYRRDVAVFHSVTAAQAADPIPVNLMPPIVHVERDDDDSAEVELEQLVKAFGGVYRGT